MNPITDHNTQTINNANNPNNLDNLHNSFKMTHFENKLNPESMINQQRGFQEVWYLKLNDPLTQQALWIRFTVLCSRNGFKKIAETWAIYFQKTSSRDVRKVAVKQTYDINSFSLQSDSGIQIGDSLLNRNNSIGSIQSKGQSVRWNLSFISGRNSSFQFIPSIISKFRLAKYTAETLCEELMVSGTTEINGEVINWKQAFGMIGRFQGTKCGDSWVWGHCNSFLNEQGKPTSFIFEGLTVRTKVGPMKLPNLSSFYFYYKDKDYYFNTLKDAIYLKSKNTLNHWKFQADRNDISFRGYVKSEHKDFAGLSYEDTNGSLLYCSNSEVAEMKILVYRRGKLEATFNAPESAGFEIVSRDKNPYVPILV